MKHAHFFVSGEVQGVFYRHNTIKKARELGLVGFVRNTHDSKAEVVAEGDDKKVDELISFCQNHPGFSRVENLEIKEEKKINALDFRDFRVKYKENF